MTDSMQDKPVSLPDPLVCRTRVLGPEGAPFQCLVPNPNGCQYALPAVTRVYCFHPDRSKLEQPPAKSDKA